MSRRPLPPGHVKPLTPAQAGRGQAGEDPPPAPLPAPPTRRRRKLAAAIRYAASAGDPPVVVASGEGPIAEQITAIARAQGVAIAEDSDLAEALARVEPGTPIPNEAFVAVAAIIAPLLRHRPAASQGAKASSPRRSA